jgi:acyl carrier protein
MTLPAGVERVIRQILSDITLNPECMGRLSDVPLESTGIDSVGMIELVYALEERFGIEIGDEEVVPENFGSIRSLTDLVARKCP